jgi:hypothetical protein
MSLRGEPKVLECFGTRTPPGTGAARQIVRRSWTAVPRADDASPPALLRPGSSAGVQIPPPLGGWNGSAGSAGKCPAARWTGRRRRSNLSPGEQPRARTSASPCSQHSQLRRPVAECPGWAQGNYGSITRPASSTCGRRARSGRGRSGRVARKKLWGGVRERLYWRATAITWCKARGATCAIRESGGRLRAQTRKHHVNIWNIWARSEPESGSAGKGKERRAQERRCGTGASRTTAWVQRPYLGGSCVPWDRQQPGCSSAGAYAKQQQARGQLPCASSGGGTGQWEAPGRGRGEADRIDRYRA